MKIIFLSQDGSIHRLIDALEGDINKAESEEEVLELLEEIDEDEECLLFLDFDGDQKGLEKFNKSIFKNDWITRIIISGEMKVKDFKKHQKGKTAAHGYVLKPFTADVFKSILNDLEISHLIEEQNLYEEGQNLPDLPSTPQGVSGFESATEEYLEEVEEEEEFSPAEFQMNTEVRNLVDLHSVKGDAPPFDGQLNEKIQAKFDEVFGPYDDEDDNFGMADDSFMGGQGPNEDMGLSLKEETQESISLDLGGDDTASAELSIDGGGGDEEIDLEADLNIDDDSSEPEVQENEAIFDDGEEIDLEAMDLDESEDFDSGDAELDLSEDDGGELDLSEESDDEIDLLEGDDSLEGDLESEDLEEELTRLTEERALPSQEELAEFEEDTGEFEVEPNATNDEMQFDKPDSPTTSDSSSVDSTGELENELQTSDSAHEEESEDMEMSDEDQNDELLEFDDEEVEVEGELAFSTEPEEDEAGGEEDEGGLDFNLGDDAGDDEDELSVQASSDEAGQAASVDGGFELDSALDDDDDMEIESGGVSAEATSSITDGGQDLDLSGDAGDLELGDDDGGGLDLSSGSASESDDDEGDDLDFGGDDDGDDDEFDLGTDAALSADDEPATEDVQLSASETVLDEGAEEELDEEGSLEFSDDDDKDFEVPEGDDADVAATPAGERSEFDEDELAFADDEDEEIEKTQAISVNKRDLSAGSDDEADDDVEFGGDLENDIEDELEEDDDIDGLDAEATNEFENDEELLNEDFGEDTKPTVVMSQEATRDLEDMVDNQVTNEFRPQGMEDSDTALMDQSDFDDEGLDDGIGDELEPDVVEEVAPVAKASTPAKSRASQKSDDGELKITPAEDRLPPSFNEGEAVRLQATIRQLREEREELLKEIQDLKKDKKVTEQENLGLKAELDEAKIEISILKKRHSGELDEMKYRLRITDEKKLYAEEKARKLQKEFDRLQSKVRIDFNQIKQREKELESQLELVKMDTESQVQSRDKKILELKRKIDQLEFNMENIVIREQKSRDDKVRLEERLERIMKTLRGSIEVLEDDIEFDNKSKRNRD